MRKSIIAIAAISAISAQPAWSFTYGGVGTNSCGWWTQSERQNEFAGRQWVLGFAAGAAAWGEKADPLDGTDAAGMWAWVDRYCWDHPTDTIETAADNFVGHREAVKIIDKSRQDYILNNLPAANRR